VNVTIATLELEYEELINRNKKSENPVTVKLPSKLILNVSDDGVLYLKESRFWALSIVKYLLRNTTFRKLDPFPSSGKIMVTPTYWVP
jgi:hypothetical protein